MRKYGLWLLALSLLVVLLPVSAQGGALYSVETIECPGFVDLSRLPTPENEGETYECGVVVVPENYAEPDGPTLELMYLRLFSMAESPAADPLLYLTGGPGGPGLHELVGPGPLENMQFVRASRDVVVYDQRGTGLTRPLLCGPAQAGIGAAIELLPDLADDIRTIEENSHWGAIALNYLVCAAAYAEAGVDLTQINSIVSTHDMASLMTALDYDQYNLYGTSYGTKLSQVALRETPDRLRSVVLDGTTDITGGIIADAGVEGQEQYTHIFEQCAADAACNAAYPNLPERFSALLDELATNPIVLDEPIQPGGYLTLLGEEYAQPIETLDNGFFEMLIDVNSGLPTHVLGRSATYVGRVPRMILALEAGDVDYIRAVIEGDGPPTAEEEAAVESVIQEPDLRPDNEFLAASIDTLLEQAEREISDASTPEAQWVSLAVNDLAARLAAGEDQTAVIEDMITLTMLPVYGPDAQALMDYANEYLPEAAAAEANALVEGMTRVDVRATMLHLSEIASAMAFNLDGEQLGGLHSFVTWAVNCPESVVFHSQADVDAAIAAADYPQLDIFDDNTFAFFQVMCSFFPPTEYIDSSFLEPVVSDTPVLLLQGALDSATPISGARAVANRLSNSTMVVFDSEGHVVAGHHGQCPGMIAAQFLDDPMGDLDTSCADAFVIEFDLPE